MGEKTKETLKLQFDSWLRLEFQGASITSGVGLLACRELDGVPCRSLNSRVAMGCLGSSEQVVLTEPREV